MHWSDTLHKLVVHLILFVDGTKYLTSPDPQEMWKSRHYIVSILIRKGATETLPVGELHSYLSQSKIRKKNQNEFDQRFFYFFQFIHRNIIQNALQAT